MSAQGSGGGPGWHVVRLHEVPLTPWRNGGGTTQELCAFPQHAQWHWRISLAEIVRPGPFSAYGGVERLFAVVQGAGVRLRWPDHEVTATTADEPVRFDGAAPPACDLVAGPTQDLNLMVRRGRGTMRRTHGTGAVVVSSGSAVALWTGAEAAEAMLGGQLLRLPPFALAWRHLDHGGRVDLRAPDGLWMEITT